MSSVSDELDCAVDQRLVIGMLLLVCSGSCFSADDTAAPSTEMLLQRSGIEPVGQLYVYESGEWQLISETTCSVAKGTLSSAELALVLGNVADPALQALPTTCMEQTSLKLTNAEFHVVACWNPSSSTIPAAAALAQFFDDRANELHWDGQHKNCQPPRT